MFFLPVLEYAMILKLALPTSSWIGQIISVYVIAQRERWVGKFFKANSTQPTNLKGRLQVMIGTCVQPQEIKVVPHCTQVWHIDSGEQRAHTI